MEKLSKAGEEGAMRGQSTPNFQFPTSKTSRLFWELEVGDWTLTKRRRFCSAARLSVEVIVGFVVDHLPGVHRLRRAFRCGRFHSAGSVHSLNVLGPCQLAATGRPDLASADFK